MSISAFSALAPVLDYLRPTKSPYLMMIIFGVVAAIKTADSFFAKEEWVMMLLPQFIALIIFTAFSFYSKEVFDEEDNITDQLRFSRAITIATAVMCLAFGAPEVVGSDYLFNVIYITCLFQLVVFLIYTAARVIKEEKVLDFNFFQFSIITSTFLIGATYCLTKVEIEEKKPNYLYNLKEQVEHVDLNIIVAIILYSLWLVCIRFWVKRVLAVVRVKVVDE